MMDVVRLIGERHRRARARRSVLAAPNPALVSSILITILPVFGLIAIGFVSAKTRFIGASAAQGLSLFVFNLALPALLFRTMVLMEPQGSELVPLWIAYFGGLVLVWIAASIARASCRRSRAAAALRRPCRRPSAMSSCWACH